MSLALLGADILGPDVRAWHLPQLLSQGRALKRDVLQMPEPPGPREGHIEGQGEPLRLLVLGDSAAVGVGATSQENALAATLARELAARTGRPVSWRARGRSGLTAAQCREELPALLADVDDAPLHFLATSLGGNDVVKLTRAGDFSRAMHDIAATLTRRLAPEGRGVFGRAPPFASSPMFRDPLRKLVAWRVERINELLAAVADGHGSLRLAGLPLEAEPADFAEDQFHPSERGYRAWADHLADLFLQQ